MTCILSPQPSRRLLRSVASKRVTTATKLYLLQIPRRSARRGGVSADGMVRERQRALLSANPVNAGGAVTALEMDSYAPTGSGPNGDGYVVGPPL
jgi:hypothetical protein